MLSYHLQWDNATGGVSWFDVIGFTPPSLLLQTSVTSQVVGGRTYLFRVRAQNIQGWASIWSDPEQIKAA